MLDSLRELADQYGPSVYAVKDNTQVYRATIMASITQKIAERFKISADAVNQFMLDEFEFNHEYAKQGRIQAIKEFRGVTGCGLHEAKEAVEAIMAVPSSYPYDGMLALRDEIIGLERRVNDLLLVVDAMADEDTTNAMRDLLRRLVSDSSANDHSLVGPTG